MERERERERGHSDGTKLPDYCNNSSSSQVDSGMHESFVSSHAADIASSGKVGPVTTAAA